MPPVVVVQHMPPVFTRMFAESLSKVSRVRVKEAEEGDRLEKGLVLVAPGDRHLRVEKSPLGLVARLDSGPKVSGHRPSVDVLFESVAALGRQGTAALLLTGMGKDGAAGMLALRRAGATCLAQDEASSVVFGMPKEAWENGGAERLVGIERAARELVDCFRRGVPAGAAGDGSRSGWRR